MNIQINNTYRIKGNVDHQNIGGKEIRIEMELTPDEVDKQAWNGNIACLNFCMRRRDFLPSFNKKLYYGHVNNLGYIVCEDELEECSSTLDREEDESLLKRLKMVLKRVLRGDKR